MTTPTQSKTSVTVDDVFALLAEQRRRHLLEALSAGPTPAPLASLADEITARRYGEPPTEHLQERRQIYMTLYHADVPKLEQFGVVSYTQDSDTVEWGENASAVLPYLDQVAPSDSPSPRASEPNKR